MCCLDEVVGSYTGVFVSMSELSVSNFSSTSASGDNVQAADRNVK